MNAISLSITLLHDRGLLKKACEVRYSDDPEYWFEFWSKRVGSVKYGGWKIGFTESQAIEVGIIKPHHVSKNRTRRTVAA